MSLKPALEISRTKVSEPPDPNARRFLTQRLSRYALSVLVVGAGIASLLATSPPPPPSFGLKTLNNFDVVRSRFEGDNKLTFFACKGERAQLYWQGFNGERWTLSTDSPESFSPPLTEQQVEGQGSLDLSVLAAAEVSFTARGNDPDGSVSVKLLPEALCTGFGFPLVGLYEATLEQTAPVPTTLSQPLRLIYVQNDAEAANLRFTFSRDYYPYRDSTRCQLEGSSLSCTDAGEVRTEFTLSAQVTATGLEGRYSGVQETAEAYIPYEGTLTAVKTIGSPEPGRP